LRDLHEIKERLYGRGRFQLQFSINSTDPATRRRLVPFPHLSLEDIAQLGAPFHGPGDRRVVLNFALHRGCAVDPVVLRQTFDPEHFMVKLTPVNPTERARQSHLDTVLSAASPEAAADLVADLEAAGFETVVSIGEADEITIGSNCGQVARARRTQDRDNSA
jgi:23S rRNA (adenine2503-C2)-methyltransferase